MVFIITLSDLLNKIKSFFIKSNKSSNNADDVQFGILANESVESPSVSFQLLFKVYKDKLNSSLTDAKSLRLNLNSMYLDDFDLTISKEKEFTELDNPCGKDLKKITGYYFWDKKYVSSGVYFNAALLNDVNFQDPNPVIEVYDFAESSFTVLPFQYCSTEVPNPTKYDFLVNIKAATTLLNPMESEEDVDYYVYTADMEGKIYLAPLVEITGDSYTLAQLNELLGKDSSNTRFSHGELASITALSYTNINPLNLNFDNFQYFINLSHLIINNCSYNSIPTEFCNLSKLQVLNLMNNNITTIPSCLSNLNSLQELNVDYNSIYNLSLFKDKNISISANNQFIYRTIGEVPYGGPGHKYEFNIEFLRDFNDEIPTISDINGDGVEEIINGERHIVWINPLNHGRRFFKFASSSGSSNYNGIVNVTLT